MSINPNNNQSGLTTGFTNTYCIPNIVLKSTLNNKQAVNICHLNSQSILPKINEIKAIFANVNTHAICVSESWLKSYISNRSILLDGYNVFRNDRAVRRGGGVCIFVKSSIPVRIVYESDDPHFNVICIEMLFSNEKFFLGVVYNPPDNNFTNELECILNSFSINYSNVILVGDFNYDLLSTHNKVKEFKDILNRYSICMCNNEPTHFTATSSSLLDLVLSNSDRVFFLNQLSIPGISHQ